MRQTDKRKKPVMKQRNFYFQEWLHSRRAEGSEHDNRIREAKNIFRIYRIIGIMLLQQCD